jgi:formylmethanofuran dehydrogenase subunit C
MNVRRSVGELTGAEMNVRGRIGELTGAEMNVRGSIGELTGAEMNVRGSIGELTGAVLRIIIQAAELGLVKFRQFPRIFARTRVGRALRAGDGPRGFRFGRDM